MVTHGPVGRSRQAAWPRIVSTLGEVVVMRGRECYPLDLLLVMLRNATFFVFCIVVACVQMVDDLTPHPHCSIRSDVLES